MTAHMNCPSISHKRLDTPAPVRGGAPTGGMRHCQWWGAEHAGEVYLQCVFVRGGPRLHWGPLVMPGKANKRIHRMHHPISQDDVLLCGGARQFGVRLSSAALLPLIDKSGLFVPAV